MYLILCIYDIYIFVRLVILTVNISVIIALCQKNCLFNFSRVDFMNVYQLLLIEIKSVFYNRAIQNDFIFFGNTVSIIKNVCFIFTNDMFLLLPILTKIFSILKLLEVLYNFIYKQLTIRFKL